MTAMSQGVADATVVTIGGYVAAQKLGFHSLIDLSQANIPYEAASLITTRTLISTTVSINSWYYAWKFAQEVNSHAQAG
jgi:hypothetical protein